MANETALAIIETINALDFFKSGAHTDILDRLEAEVREQAKDLSVSRPADREAIRSLAAKVGKTKNGLDRAGKELVEGEKKRLKLIDTERGIVWDRVEALQEEVRKPLTDWENTEKYRIAKHEAELSELSGAGTWAQQNWQTLSVECMTDRLNDIKSMQYDWQEFLDRAKVAVVTSISQLKDAIAKRQKADDDAAELIRLREEQAKRDQEEREARIAREAKEAAEVAAEDKAARDAQEAEERAVAAAEAAAKAQAAAVEAERKRQEDEAKRAKEAAEKREADREHSARINNEVLTALVALDVAGITGSTAKAIVSAISQGKIPHTKISY